MRREITVLVCLVILGEGRYLSDDRKNYKSQRHFELQKGLNDSYNTKREAYPRVDQFHDRNTYASRVLIEEYESYVDTKYEMAFLPDYVIFRGHISAKSESTGETTTSKSEVSTTHIEGNDKIKEKESNIDMLPNLQLNGDKKHKPKIL